jgi:ribosome-binding factor A
VGHRLLRINERIKEVVAASIADKVKDPRLGFITVTGVETSADLRHAKVYVSVLGSASEVRASLTALQRAHAVLQTEINAGLRMKRTPQITFVHDETPARAQKIERLLREEEAALGAAGPAGSASPVGPATTSEDDAMDDGADEREETG